MMEGESRPETFIDKYMRYTAGHEAPDIFHVWSALTSVGFALGRTAYINQGFYTVYPNFFTILVAGSGACRKGGALGTIRDIINEAIGPRPDRLFIPGKIYPEALLKEIDKRADDPFGDEDVQTLVYRPVMLFSPELGSFMSKHMQQSGMPDLLMELHDCPDTHNHITKNSGVNKLEDVFVSLLAATTPIWMQQNMSVSMLSEGFIARTILVYADQPKLRVARPDFTPELQALREELITDLKTISLMRGEFFFSPEAGQAFDTWYENYSFDPHSIEQESGFVQREHAHVLRVAMCFAACVNSFTIHEPHIQAAIELVKQVRLNMSIPLMGANAEPDMRNKYRVRECLKKHGERHGLTAQELYRRLFNYMSPDTIQEQLIALKAAGVIEYRNLKGNDGNMHVFYRVVEYVGREVKHDDVRPDLSA